MFGEAADDGGDAVAHAHDGAVHFAAEETGAARIDAEGFVGEPEFFTPDHAWFHIGGERIDEQLLAGGHLRGVLGADEDIEIGGADDGDDGIAERRVVVLLHLDVATVFGFVERITGLDAPVGGVAEIGDAAEKFSVGETVCPEKGGGGGIVADVGGKGAVGAKLDDR